MVPLVIVADTSDPSYLLLARSEISKIEVITWKQCSLG